MQAQGKRMRNYIIGLLMVMFAGFAGSGVYAADFTAVEAAFDRGVQQYETGNLEGAVLAFEEVLRLRPDAEAAIRLRDKVGHMFFVQLLVDGVHKDKRLGTVAERFMELTTRSIKMKRVEPATIEGLVKDLEKDFETRWRAILDLCTIGEPAVPYLVPALGNQQDDDLRANTVITLTKMGRVAALPVIEALDSSNVYIRQNAAAILGNIREDRAIAALKRVIENPKEIPEVRKHAETAILKITGNGSDMLPSAKELYLELAKNYYLDHPSVMRPLLESRVQIWNWHVEDDNVVATEVPSYAYNELLAEEACYEALKLDTNYSDVLPLALCVYLAQINEVEDLVILSKIHQPTGGISNEEAATLEARLNDLRNVDLFAAFGGLDVFDRALAVALDSQDETVAVSCIESMTQVAKEASPTVIRALDYPDKRVKYAAAMALATINPQMPYEGMEKVMPTLNHAVGEAGVRVVLLIDGDKDHLNLISGHLRLLNCVVVSADNGPDGLSRARRFPAEDMIIITQTLPESDSQEIVMKLRDDFRTEKTPIFVMGNLVEQDKLNQIFGEMVNGYMDAGIDKVGLASYLEEVFSTEAVLADAKSEATRIAAAAAKVLAGVPRMATPLNLDTAQDALVKSLAIQPDEVRLPALQAINNIGLAGASDAVIAVLTNPESVKAIRLNCLDAIGGIIERRSTVQTEEMESLVSALNEEDQDIRQHAANALGRAGSLGVPNLNRIFLNQRIGLALPKKEAASEEEETEEADKAADS